MRLCPSCFRSDLPLRLCLSSSLTSLTLFLSTLPLSSHLDLIDGGNSPSARKGLYVHVRSMAGQNINTAPFKEDLLGVWTFVTNPIMPTLNFYHNKPEINFSWSFYQLGTNQSMGARCWRYTISCSVVIYIRLNLCCGSELWCRQCSHAGEQRHTSKMTSHPLG